MKTLPQPISDAERAVSQYKHKLLVLVMAHIVRTALVQPHVSAKDVPEDIIEKESRQGCASAAWNCLRAIEVIEPVPMNLSDDRYGIVYGRIKNENPMAHGRWVCAYRLKSRAAAYQWMAANNIPYKKPESEKMVQIALV